MGKGRSLELYFIDGKPDGMLTAEVFNWTGHVLKFPRTRIAEALRREEAEYTGVYILLGEIGGAEFYIGADQYETWKHTSLTIDVIDGKGGMFSLDNGTGKRFITRSDVCEAD